MMSVNTIATIALWALGALAAPENSAAKECGDLGVNNVDISKLPANVNPNAIRKCLEHPGPAARFSANEARGLNILQERQCWKGKSPGCSKEGWCYKSCESEQAFSWCWLAENYGWGDWTKCSNDGDCSRGGIDCGLPDECMACGCGC